MNINQEQVYILPMALILDGEHVGSNLCYLICQRQLIWSRAGKNHIIFSKKDLFSFMRAQHVYIPIYYKYHVYYQGSRSEYFSRIRIINSSNLVRSLKSSDTYPDHKKLSFILNIRSKTCIFIYMY